jgi:hypothetical protein
MVEKIDPTKNVLDLVGERDKKWELARESDLRYNEAMRAADAKFNEAALAAAVKGFEDTFRIKSDFDNQRTETLRIQVVENAKLVSTQLAETNAAMSNRVVELERDRNLNSGKTAGSKDVMAYVMAIITAGIAIAIALYKH